MRPTQCMNRSHPNYPDVRLSELSLADQSKDCLAAVVTEFDLLG